MDLKEKKMTQEEFEKQFKLERDLLQRKLEEFIKDMQDLGQTELCASGPGYKISFEIEKKKEIAQ